MRGFFGVGVEGISKAYNAGALFRTAHAFGASFIFTVGAAVDVRQVKQTDTSASAGHVPYYEFPRAADILLPKGCALVGVELTEDAVDLPSFRHPLQAAYILGPERGSLSAEIQERCDFTVRIPTKFCINVGLAGAVVMYDRMIHLGRFPARPSRPGDAPEPLPPHIQGAPLWVRKDRKRAGKSK